MTKILANKVAIVTGAGNLRGIGRAAALKLASHGADVVVTDQALTVGLKELAAEIAEMGSRSLAVALDVADAAQISACASMAVEKLGGIDILVNNAGTTVGARPFLDISDSDWDISYFVNLRGPAQFCRAVIPIMIERGGGAIINNASTAGLGAEAGFGAYSASKHALVALTKTIAAEFGSQGIRCNAVCPGFVKTDMHMSVNERLALESGIDADEIASRRYLGVAMKRAGEPAEVADAIAYLASPASSYITGIALAVAGGTSVGL
jgi:NAD(P)-dependent dehydrogenase (short-subunit alcohol dehydrogenase family)